jgi:hypothetical protein
MATDAHPPGVVGLLVQLQAYGVEPVRHGRFLGLRGRAVGQVPPELWDLLRSNERALNQTVPQTPTPYQQRGFGR